MQSVGSPTAFGDLEVALGLCETRIKSLDEAAASIAGTEALSSRSAVVAETPASIFRLENELETVKAQLSDSRKEVAQLRKALVSGSKDAFTESEHRDVLSASARSSDYNGILRSTMMNNSVLLKQLVDDKERYAQDIERMSSDFARLTATCAESSTQLERERNMRKAGDAKTRALRLASAKAELAMKWYREKVNALEKRLLEHQFDSEKVARLERENRQLRRKNARLSAVKRQPAPTFRAGDIPPQWQ